MNLIEAIQSGKRFRYKSRSWITLIELKGEDRIPVEFAISDDWEIEEEKIKITRKQLYDAMLNCLDAGNVFFHEGKFPSSYELLSKELGFKDEK